MVRVYGLRVQWGESAGSHATPSSLCAKPLGHERAGEPFALPGVRGTKGKEVEGGKAARGQTHPGPCTPEGPSPTKRSNGTLTCGEKEPPLAWSGGDAGIALNPGFSEEGQRFFWEQEFLGKALA